LVAASTTVMRILYSDEVEIFLPVRALFLQRRRAVADFDPARGLVRKKSRIVHVAKVFSLSHGTLAQCAAVDSFEQRTLAAGFHTGFHVVSHTVWMTREMCPMRTYKRNRTWLLAYKSSYIRFS